MKYNFQMQWIFIGIVLLLTALSCEQPESEQGPSENGYPITFRSPIPPDSAILDTWSLDLSWQRDGITPDSFEERVLLYHGFADIVLDEFEADGDSVHIPVISAGRHRWQVIGTDDAETLGVSDIWMFQTLVNKPAPYSIAAIFPIDGDTIDSQNIILQWWLYSEDEAPADLKYRVYFGPANGEKRQIADNLESRRLEVSIDEPYQWYRWSISVLDSGLSVYDSPDALFYVNPPGNEVYGWIYRLQHKFDFVCFSGPPCFRFMGLIPLSEDKFILTEEYETGSAHSGLGTGYSWYEIQVDDQQASIGPSVYFDGSRLFAATSEELFSTTHTFEKIVVGHEPYEYYIPLDRKILIRRQSLDGAVLWSHTFFDTLQEIQVLDGNGDTLTKQVSGWNTLGGLVKTDDGVLVTGSLLPHDSTEAFLISYKLDAMGNELWRRFYRTEVSISGVALAENVGGYHLLAEEKVVDGSSMQYRSYQLSEDGEIIASQPLEVQGDFVQNRIVSFNDGGFGMCLVTSDYRVLLVRISGAGEMLWERELDINYSPQIAPTPEGNLVAMVDNRLESFNENGNLMWSRIYHLLSGDHPRICAAKGGGFYLVIHDYDPSDRDYDYILAYADEFGRNSWVMYQE
ncbi:MAG: hypothetical protein V2A56_00145 [bacterium]